MKKIREDFINQYPPLNLMKVSNLDICFAPTPIHMYIHIPFCIKKCSFCYYKSFEVPYDGVPDEYISALIKELQLYVGENVILRSLYLGGGTPTMLTSYQLDRLLKYIFSNFKTTEDFEFCSEARPGLETTEEKISLMVSYGIKRVSIGCQHLDDVILKLNGRNHTSKSFFKCFELLRKKNVFAINVDLMTGMIGDSPENFLSSLDQLLSLGPENITIYKMQLYYNSILYRKLRSEDDLSLLSDLEEYNLAFLAYEKILNEKYEFADNFSFKKSSRYSHLHRLGTWSGEPMLGIGISAHSLNQNHQIYQNYSDFDKYYSAIKIKEKPIYRAYQMSIYEQMLRELIFGIKSVIYDSSTFQQKFGLKLEQVFGDELNRLMEMHLINWENNRIYLDIRQALLADDSVRLIFPFNQDKIIMGHQERKM